MVWWSQRALLQAAIQNLCRNLMRVWVPAQRHDLLGPTDALVHSGRIRVFL